MNKALLILSMLAMLATGYFAYNNRTQFVSYREDKFRTNDQVVKQVQDLKGRINEIGVSHIELVDLGKDITAQEALLSQTKQDVNLKQNNLKAAQDKLELANTKIAEYKLELQKLPPGIRIESLETDIAKMQLQIADNRAAAKKLTEDIETAKTDLDKSKKTLVDLQQAQQVRRTQFSRNAMEARVTSVNTDWGFIVLNAGRNKGIAPDATLVVTRGGQSVAKVKAATVEPSLTVANIIKGTQAYGMQIQNGDRVILETLYK